MATYHNYRCIKCGDKASYTFEDKNFYCLKHYKEEINRNKQKRSEFINDRYIDQKTTTWKVVK